VVERIIHKFSYLTLSISRVISGPFRPRGRCTEVLYYFNILTTYPLKSHRRSESRCVFDCHSLIGCSPLEHVVAKRCLPRRGSSTAPKCFKCLKSPVMERTRLYREEKSQQCLLRVITCHRKKPFVFYEINLQGVYE